jgi:nucleoside phosphorylase/DNA-binding NarL/FixJ family response regulator
MIEKETITNNVNLMYKILVIDNEPKPEWLQELYDLLKAEFPLTRIENLAEARKVIKSQEDPFHVVVTEICLDELQKQEEGFDLAQEINNRGEHTQVIFFSKYVSNEDTNYARRAYKEFRAHNYIEKKPNIHKNDFIKSIREAAEEAEGKRSILIVMPPTGYESLYEQIEKTLKKSGLDCVQANYISQSHLTIKDIIQKIQAAKIIIAVLSNDDLVNFEIGIAHAKIKPVLLLAQNGKGNPEGLLGNLNYLKYKKSENTDNFSKNLIEAIRKIQNNEDTPVLTKVKTKSGSFSCFVLQPEDADGDGQDTYDRIIKPAVDFGGLAQCFRSQDIYDDALNKHWDHINWAALVVADLTIKDRDMNYLLGLVHGSQKPGILITQTKNNIPDHFKTSKAIIFSKHIQNRCEDAQKKLTRAIRTLLLNTTPNPSKDNNMNELRRLLLARFDDPELEAFCQDYFPEVRKHFSRGLRLDEKIILLLDECNRHDQLAHLANLLANKDTIHPENPTQPQSCSPTPTPPILIIAVTRTEVRAILKTFSVNIGKARKTIGEKIYYNLGIYGEAPVFMIQSEMGVATPGGALLTVHQAIQDLHPQAVILCGIAYGLHPDQQKLGDILIARQITYYEPQTIDMRRGQIPRGDRTTASERLLNLLRSADIDWDGAPTHFGLVLSGEKLVNDPAFRDWLLKVEPEAIGGEMEGAGLYTAAREAKADWILVKAVCDWADGKKDDAAQELAANNAAQFLLHALRIEKWNDKISTALKPLSKDLPTILPPEIVILTVLPEEYQAVCKQFSNLYPPVGLGEMTNLYAWQAGDIYCEKFNRSYRAVIGMTGRAGPNPSALAISDAIRNWNPRYIFFVGIAGGLAKLQKGDVIIADMIYGYEYGKITTQFDPRSNWSYTTDQGLLNGTLAYALLPEWRTHIHNFPPADCQPKVHSGEIASGDKVIDNPDNDFFKPVMERWPKLRAVEMEGAGVGAAIQQAQASGKAVGFMMIRGISDLPRSAVDDPKAGTTERDDWKPYASETAAAFTIGYIADGLPVPPQAA